MLKQSYTEYTHIIIMQTRNYHLRELKFQNVEHTKFKYNLLGHNLMKVQCIIIMIMIIAIIICHETPRPNMFNNKETA